MATHSSIHAWRIPWTEEPGGLYSHGDAKSQIQLSHKYAHMVIPPGWVKVSQTSFACLTSNVQLTIPPTTGQELQAGRVWAGVILVPQHCPPLPTGFDTEQAPGLSGQESQAWISQLHRNTARPVSAPA